MKVSTCMLEVLSAVEDFGKGVGSPSAKVGAQPFGFFAMSRKQQPARSRAISLH